jgi:hypothetical protein
MGVAFADIVKRASDLETPRAAVVKGFLEQARQKRQKANEFIREVRQLQTRLEGLPSTSAILQDPDLLRVVLLSAGFSQKALSHLKEDERKEIASEMLRDLGEAQGDFASDILYRYLLTQGDSLGGSMRNVVGASAQRAFTAMVLESLQSAGVNPRTESWEENGKTQGIAWNDRKMLFDKTPKFVRKNVDVILLWTDPPIEGSLNQIEDKGRYLAAGELKGGIDPAGADEHWKTAKTALDRIRKAFRPGRTPCLFFAGVAIEREMAKELYRDVKEGNLSFAANLTSEEQTRALISWLIAL